MGKAGWYVVMVETGAELDAVEWLRRRRVASYTPRARERRRKERASGWAVIERAAFPGYLFVRLQEVQAVEIVTKTIGFRTIVQDGDGRPLLASPAEIDAIMTREVDGEFETSEPTAISFRVGDRVLIAQGAMSGRDAAVIEIGRHGAVVAVDGMTYPAHIAMAALARR